MALSGTNRGTGGNNTASTTINISPASNFTSGSSAFLAIAYDNAGSQGSDPYSSISDGVHTWVTAASLNDPGAANAGSVLRLFRANNVSLTTSSVITITFSVNVTAKAWTLTQIASDISGASINQRISWGPFTTGGQSILASGTGNIVTGNILIGYLGQEGNGTRTGDSDTTNGTWSTAQTAGFGTTTGGQEIITQFKVVTADGNQQWDPVATPVGDYNIWLFNYEEIPPASSFDPFGMMGFFGI